jgi:hypothetical protein
MEESRGLGSMCRHHALLSLSVFALLLSAAPASRLAAQSGSGSMGQGEANISVRSDVTLSVKGTGGTSSERLSKLGQSVSDQMVEIRSCYRTLVKDAPEVMGKVRFKLRLDKENEKDKKPELEVLDQSGGAEPLVQCVTKVLTTAKYVGVGRPASAFLSMTFDNSRARGQAEMTQRAAKLAHVDVRDTLSGQREANWATEGDEVKFRIRADPAEPQDSVGVVMNWIRKNYAAFLDCRRRSEQGGISPEGDIEMQVSVDARGQGKVKYGTVTVTHARARTCTEPLFKKLPFDKPSAPLNARLDVHFAP